MASGNECSFPNGESSKKGMKLVFTKIKNLTCLFLFVFFLFTTKDLYQENQGLKQEVAELNAAVSQLSYTVFETDTATALTRDRLTAMEQDMERLYNLSASHENCVALSMLAGQDAVLAAQYDRTVEQQNALYSDDVAEYFHGRLYIPDAKIDVALYHTHKQAVTDRKDSANIFVWKDYSGETIADHNNQEFSKLFSVEVGMTGYIQLASGDIVNIECVEVFDGHNVGKDITDNDGVSAMGRADYMMYTCRNGWQNVRICLWETF